MEHVEMGRPDGTCSSGAEDGLLRKTKTGEEKRDIWGGLGGRQGTRGRGLGEEEKKRVYAGAGKQARGEEAKAGEQTFRFGYYVFLCIFYFFHISHVSFSMISTPFAGLLHLVVIVSYLKTLS